MSSSPTCPALVRTLALLALIALSGCMSSEDRQARYFERAQTLYAGGDYDKARVEVRNVLQINENHAEARYLYALLLEREQNWRQMFANLLLAVDLAPDLIDAQIKLGQTYYRAQAYDKALEHAEAVLALDEASADGHTLRGSVFYRRGDTFEALEEARLALEAEPGHVGATSIITEVYKQEEPDRALAAIADAMQQSDVETLTLLKINVLEGRGDTEGVVSEYQGLIAAHPENLFYHYKLVQFYEAQERIDEAEKLLRSIVNTQPDNLQLKLWLAEFLANQRNLNLAEETVREFIQREPGIYELRFALGKIYTALQQYDAAAQVYGEVIALDEEGADSQQARNELVKLRLTQGEETEAQVLLDEIFAIEDENTEALITTARLALSRGDFEAAIPRLRTAIKNSPTSYEALVLLARAHETEGSRDLALDNYRNAAALRPAEGEALLGAARLLIEAGDTNDALQLLDPFVAANPEEGDAIGLLVSALVVDQNLDRAIAVAEKTIASNDNAALGYYLKGRLQLKQDAADAAIDSFKTSLELEPRSEQPLRYLVQTWVSSDEAETAETYLRDRTETMPGAPLNYELLAGVLVVQERMDEARSVYEQVLEMAPGNRVAMRGLTRIAPDDDELKALIPIWERAIEEAPADVSARLALASIYERLRTKYEAKALYLEILDIQQDNLLAANNLVMLIIDNDPSEAELAEAAGYAEVLRTRKEAAFRDTLAWLMYRNGDTDAAISILEELVKEQPEDPNFAFHFGAALLAKGEAQQARAYLEKAIDSLSDIATPTLREAELLLSSIER